MENVVLNEIRKIAKEFNKKEQLIKIMLYNSKKEGYNTNESLQNIEEFLKKSLVQNLSNNMGKYRKV